MENNKKQLKINLVTAIVLIVIAIVVIALIITILKKNSNKIVIGNEITQPEIQNHKVENEVLDFSFNFLKMENKKENIIYSPLSIKYALQMLDKGANGNTKKQIESVIGNTNLVKYNNINNILSLANALFIRDTYSNFVKEDYKKTLQNQYNAEIKYDSFKNANNINNWIENKTFGQIKNMLEDRVVKNSDNAMFLVNALAIDMSWKDSFDSKNTHGDTFYLDNGTTMKATTMHKETNSENVSYYQDKNVTALAMDLEQYDNEQMEFIAIMPNSNLTDYVEKFSIDDLNKITNNLTLASKTKKGLDIYIPRFSFNYELNLESDLKKSGITDAFDSNLADFSNISSKQPLWIGGALHKSNVDFTEKGIKAAAVTVIYMTMNAALVDEDQPVEIKIDKPFMFIIRDKKTSEIWFVGTVYKPNLWEKDKVDYKYR